MEKIIIYISLILILVCLPTKSRGQSVEIVKTSKVDKCVIISSEGLYRGAVWPIGQRLCNSYRVDGQATKSGITIRHTENQGNGNNLNVNSKLPYRLIIAPSDVNEEGLSWAEAMGISDACNQNLNATGELVLRKPEGKPDANPKPTGCAGYIPYGTNFPGYPGIDNWRLPTQRELQLIWLLRDAITQAYTLINKDHVNRFSGNYWSSTENTESSAWFLNFNSLQCNTDSKLKTYKVRCVADY